MMERVIHEQPLFDLLDTLHVTNTEPPPPQLHFRSGLLFPSYSGALDLSSFLTILDQIFLPHSKCSLAHCLWVSHLRLHLFRLVELGISFRTLPPNERSQA